MGLSGADDTWGCHFEKNVRAAVGKKQKESSNRQAPPGLAEGMNERGEFRELLLCE